VQYYNNRENTNMWLRSCAWRTWRRSKHGDQLLF